MGGHQWKLPVVEAGNVWNECTCGHIADTPQQIKAHERIVRNYKRRSKKRRNTHRGGLGHGRK